MENEVKWKQLIKLFVYRNEIDLVLFLKSTQAYLTLYLLDRYVWYLEIYKCVCK